MICKVQLSMATLNNILAFQEYWNIGSVLICSYVQILVAFQVYVFIGGNGLTFFL